MKDNWQQFDSGQKKKNLSPLNHFCQDYTVGREVREVTDIICIFLKLYDPGLGSGGAGL